MTLATAQLLRKSEQFQLVRISFGKVFRANSTLWTTAGTNLYYVSWSLGPVAGVSQIDSSAAIADFTEDSATPTVNQHFWHDTSTSRVYIYTTTDPNDLVNDTSVCVDSYLYLTTSVYRESTHDPASGGDIVSWQPRLDGFVGISQSVSDSIYGVFSFSSTSVRIINPDYDLSYLLDNKQYSFANRDVEIWHCIDDVSTATKVYKGKCKSIQSTGDSLTVAVYDAFSNLGSKSLMGDTEDESYYLKKSASYPDMAWRDNGKPVRYYPTNIGYNYLFYDSTVTTHGYYDETYVGGDSTEEIALDCVNTDYKYTGTSGSSIYNRDWSIGRVSSAGLRTQSIGSITRAATLTDIYWHNTHLYIDAHNLKLGDPLKWTTGGTPYYGIVISLDIFTYLGNTYNVVVIHDPLYTLDATSTFSVNAAPWLSILLPGFNWQRMLWDRDYTYSTNTTTGGNKEIVVTFQNSMTFDPFDPDTVKVQAILWPDNSAEHYDVVTTIAAAAGLTVDTTEVSATSAELKVSIPSLGDTEYKTYGETLGGIMSGVGGFISTTGGETIKYRWFNESPAPTTTITEDDIIDGSLSMSIDYQESFKYLRVENRHASKSNTYTYDQAYPDNYQHVLAKPTATGNFEHTFSTNTRPIARLKHAKGNQVLIVEFDTYSRLVDADVGDLITIESAAVPDGSIDCSIVAIDIGSDRVSIKAVRFA